MKLHRYEHVSGDNLRPLNELFARGWQPVREIPGSDHTKTLVLLEKESDFPTYPGDTLGGVSVDFIRGVGLFDGVSRDELREVLTQTELLTFEPGDVVFNQGDEAVAIFVILVGEVELVMPDLPLSETRIANLRAGDIFGESTFFCPAPHNITAICGPTEVTLLSIGRLAYDELHQANHPAAMKLAYNSAGLLAARLQATDRWMWDLLREDQNAEVTASWRRFRERIHGSSSAAGGFFGV